MLLGADATYIHTEDTKKIFNGYLCYTPSHSIVQAACAPKQMKEKLVACCAIATSNSG